MSKYSYKLEDHKEYGAAVKKREELLAIIGDEPETEEQLNFIKKAMISLQAKALLKGEAAQKALQKKEKELQTVREKQALVVAAREALTMIEAEIIELKPKAELELAQKVRQDHEKILQQIFSEVQKLSELFEEDAELRLEAFNSLGQCYSLVPNCFGWANPGSPKQWGSKISVTGRWLRDRGYQLH